MLEHEVYLRRQRPVPTLLCLPLNFSIDAGLLVVNAPLCLALLATKSAGLRRVCSQMFMRLDYGSE